MALDFELIERLFFQLEERSEDKIRELRYLLCLMLMRKRRLKLVKVQRGGDGEAMLVRRPRRKEEWRVFVYDFEPERLDILRGELATLLDGDFEDGADDSSDEGSGDADAVVETEVSGDEGSAEA